MAALLAATQEGPSFTISVISNALLIALVYSGQKNNFKEHTVIFKFRFLSKNAGKGNMRTPAPVGAHAAELRYKLSLGRGTYRHCAALFPWQPIGMPFTEMPASCDLQNHKQMFLFTGCAAWSLCCALAVTKSHTDHRITRQGQYYICRWLSRFQQNPLSVFMVVEMGAMYSMQSGD